MIDLSFEGAEISKGGSKYLEPGIHNVKVTEVTKGVSTQQKSPYVRITVANEAGESCSQDYYLSTEVKEGKTTSAWNISKSAILTIITAATGLDEATAKSKLVGINTENIDAKLSNILVGKPFAIKLNGKWIHPTDASKKPWVKAEFGSYLFAVPVNRTPELGTKIVIKGDAPSPSIADPSSEAAQPVNHDW